VEARIADSGSDATPGILLGGTALVISLITAGLSFRRRLPVPAEQVQPERPLDHAGV